MKWFVNHEMVQLVQRTPAASFRVSCVFFSFLWQLKQQRNFLAVPPVDKKFSLGRHNELFCTRRHPTGCPIQNDSNLSPSVESVAGVTMTRGVLLVQRLPLACSDTCIRKYAEGLDTVIDFRLSKLSLLVENTVFSACSRKCKTQAH